MSIELLIHKNGWISCTCIIHYDIHFTILSCFVYSILKPIQKAQVIPKVSLLVDGKFGFIKQICEELDRHCVHCLGYCFMINVYFCVASAKEQKILVCWEGTTSKSEC